MVEQWCSIKFRSNEEPIHMADSPEDQHRHRRIVRQHACTALVAVSFSPTHFCDVPRPALEFSHIETPTRILYDGEAQKESQKKDDAEELQWWSDAENIVESVGRVHDAPRHSLLHRNDRIAG